MTNSTSSPRQMTGLAGAIMSRPYLLLVLAPTFWGGNITAGKLAVGQIDPYLLVLGRWVGAVLVLLTIAMPHVKRDWPKIRKSLPALAFYGALGFTTFNVLMYNSALYTAAVNASIEQAAIPVFVLLANFAIFKVRAKPLQVLGLILTIFGVVWVATHGEPDRILNMSVNIGDGLVILACVCYAAYSLTLRYKPDIHWLSFILVAAGFALVAALVYQFLLGGGPQALITGIPQITPLGWLLVVYVMLFPSILAQLFYARGVELVGPNRASIFINLLPVTGTILSVIFVGEGLEIYHFTAAAFVVAGIVLAEWAVRRG